MNQPALEKSEIGRDLSRRPSSRASLLSVYQSSSVEVDSIAAPLPPAPISWSQSSPVSSSETSAPWSCCLEDLSQRCLKWSYQEEINLLMVNHQQRSSSSRRRNQWFVCSHLSLLSARSVRERRRRRRRRLLAKMLRLLLVGQQSSSQGRLCKLGSRCGFSNRAR